MAKSYHQRVSRIKARFPRAYEKWTQEEMLTLRGMVLAGESVVNISRSLERQPSAIRSRIRKLNLIKDPSGCISLNHSSMPGTEGFQDYYPTIGSRSAPLKLIFSFEWRTVLRDVNEIYSFPNQVSAYMQDRYRWPAVYRWVIFENTPEKPELMYIGSTKKLCPDRLHGYLQPGNSVTNNRLNSIFRSYRAKGYIIKIEILINLETGFDNYQMPFFHLRTHSHRQVIEEMMIDHHKRMGFELLNL